MPNHYYLKAGGLAINDAGMSATKRTTSFTTMGASAYYGTPADILLATTPPAVGDIVAVTNLYNVNYGSVAAGFEGVTFVSVDDTAADQYKKGADFGGTSFAQDFFNTGGANFVGFDLIAQDDTSLYSASARTYYQSCSVGSSSGGQNDPVLVGSTSAYATIVSLVDCDIDVNYTVGSYIRIEGGSRLEMVNCRPVSAAGALLFDASYRGAVIDIYDTDLAGFITASGSLLLDLSASNSILMNIHNCKLPSGLGIFSIAPISPDWEIHITNCSNPDVPDHDAKYYFWHESEIGSAKADIDNYLTATYDGSTGVSCIMSSSTLCSRARVLRHRLITPGAQDLTANTTYTVNLISENALDDGQVWLEAVSPDATDFALGATVTSRNTDPFSGTALTTNTEAWTEIAYTTPVKMEMAVTITGVAGNNNASVELYVCCAEPSLDFNVDIAPVIT